MSNLTKIEIVQVKASLKLDAIKAIRNELHTIDEAIRSDVISAASGRLFSIVNNCIDEAYQLGKTGRKNNKGV